jgi:hypothetical protein
MKLTVMYSEKTQHFFLDQVAIYEDQPSKLGGRQQVFSWHIDLDLVEVVKSTNPAQSSIRARPGANS